MSLILRGDIGRGLTISEMDGNFTYLESIGMSASGPQGPQGPPGYGIDVLELTLSEALDLIDTNSISPGSIYVITGVNESLYGGTNIRLEGISADKLSTDGYGEFYNPNYDTYPIWDWRESATYSVGDVRIFGGRVWVSITGTTSTSDYFTLNPDDWEIQSFTSSEYYSKSWDEITYDIDNDMILSRYESKSNNRVSITYDTADWFFCGVNPIYAFRWGHPWDRETNTGVGSCNINNGYFNCLNFIDGSISGVEVNNFSIIGEISMLNGSYLEKISLSNSSYILFCSFDDYGVYNVVIDNESFLIGLSCSNGTIYNCSLNNNSGLDTIHSDGSSFDSITLYNDSSVYGIVMSSSYINNIDFKNSSNLSNINMIESSLYSLNLNVGIVNYFSMYSSYLYSVYLDDARISEMTITYSNIFNIDMRGFSLSEYYMMSEQIAQAKFNYGNIKYQTEAYFNGSDGYGLTGSVHLENFLPAPYGFYISSITTDSYNMTYSMIPSILIGLESDMESGLNVDSGNISYIYDRVCVFDVSNGEIIPVKSGSNQLIVSEISGGTILSGNIGLEIELKNINYSWNND